MGGVLVRFAMVLMHGPFSHRYHISIFFFSILLTFLLLHDIWFAKSVLQQKRQNNGIAALDFESGII